MSTAFEVLSSDHEEVKRLLSELELGPTAASGADSDQLALRKKMVQQLVIEQSKQEAVEEMFFWPTVREYLADGEDLANQAANQEQQAKQVLHQPHPKTPATPGALKTAGPVAAAADRMRDAVTGRDE